MKIRLNFILFCNFAFGICLFSSCQSSAQNRIFIQADIAKNRIYKKLDKQKDTREFGVDTTLQPKTSDVKYLNNRNGSLKDTTSARIYNCRSSLKQDTLSINIGIGTGFVGWGFTIYSRKQFFNIEPYYWTDAVIVGAPKPTFKIITQSLILNKAQYMVGDSIWGNVKFKIMEKDGSQTITHIADGYFRSKVTKD
jgi:hypothetical protein